LIWVISLVVYLLTFNTKHLARSYQPSWNCLE